ncbi:MAG: efflux RND transporter periplasmic adaptor subunit [Prevotellaceae bacterium]|jgi:RND family efflux transporter MFP subunit|nr:efflux RND transporter periplasmic adaptor subunit [Prevotellaceae bacterium]
MNRHLTISLATAAIITVAACSGEKGTERKAKIIPVKVMEVAVSRTANTRNYIGTVEESVAVSLSFSVAGTVERIHAREGERVRKGQLLAALDTATAANSYRAMFAKLQQARDAYERLEKVHRNGSLSDIKFVEVETGLRQAESMTAIAKKNLDDCCLHSPRDGVLASRFVEAGGGAVPGATAFKLVSVDRVNVKIPVPESEIGRIARGQTARIETPALDNAVFAGLVDMKGVEANLVSHAYEVRIAVANPDERLMPGMVCKVFLSDDGATDEIVVPNLSIRIAHDGSRFVWLAEGDAARRRFVKTGGLRDGGIAIVDGLSAGDKVIVEGFAKVSEGMKVSIVR